MVTHAVLVRFGRTTISAADWEIGMVDGDLHRQAGLFARVLASMRAVVSARVEDELVALVVAGVSSVEDVGAARVERLLAL